MKVISALDRWFAKALSIIIALFTIALTLIVNIQVFARYIFNFSLGGLSDMPPYLMIFIIWFAAILAARKGDHIKIELLDLVTKNETALRCVRILILLVTTAAMGYFTYYAVLWVVESFQYGSIDPALKIMYGYLYAIIPFSGFFMALYYFVNFVKEVGALCHHS